MNADRQMDGDISSTVEALVNNTIDSVVCAELLENDEADRVSLSEELETELLGSENEEVNEDEWESCEERGSEKMEEDKVKDEGRAEAQSEDDSEDEIVVLEEHGATAQIETYENEEKRDGEFERPLLPGDRVWVEKYEYISGKEFLDRENWIYAGLIQCQAKATKVKRAHLARQEDQEGLVVDVSRSGRAAVGKVGAVVVAAHGMVRAMALYERQLHPEIRMGDLRKAQLLKVQLAKIPEKWLVGPNYVLPNNTPVRTGMELQAEYSQEEVAVAERIIAGALVVAAEHEETLKLITQFKGVAQPQWDQWAPKGPVEQPKYFWLKFQTGDRKHVKQLTEQWATDSPLKAKADYDTDAFAQGQVILVQLNPHTGSDEQRKQFRQMVSGEEVIVQSAGAAVGFAEQAEYFGNNGPSSIVRNEDSPRAEIVKALLARPGSSGLNIPVSERIKIGLGQHIDRESVSRLNDEQKQTVALVACSQPLAILQQAPPGTGKTLTLATAIDLLTSGTARVRYSEQIRVLEDALLTEKLTDEFLATIKNKEEVMDYQQYKKQVERNPLRAGEAKVADRFLDREKQKVMFMTTHMAGRIQSAADQMTHLLLDEATQAGDVRQLGVHLRELNEVLWTGFGLESVTDQLLKSPRVEETALKKCYRSHGSLVQCVSYASYESHGEELLEVPEITERRTALTSAPINLPVADVPLVLIHSEGRIQMEETSFSLSNEDHNRIARTCVNTLDSALAKELKIVIICLYLYERDVMVRALKEDKEKGRIGRTVEVHTVDSYQAKEADVVVLITTRTNAATAGQTRTAAMASDFFKDERRATVALWEGLEKVC
uniref:AAA_12 domain-containing protein n=1 Tax=Globodera pallida TaxID=36090 RepID=A0A183C1C0_GLOPA